MNNTNYRAFFSEATKITLFCLLTTCLFFLAGCDEKTLLMVFNMAVMSSAATFSVEQKHLHHLVLGASVMIASILLGGIVGFYIPTLAQLLAIIYVGLAFYCPQKKYQFNIFAISSIMFFILTALPFSFNIATNYMLAGLIVFLLFVGFGSIFEIIKKSKMNPVQLPDQIAHQSISAMIAVISLLLAMVSEQLLVHSRF